jgi:alpha-tubulin suppressor-like RCC1 family protein
MKFKLFRSILNRKLILFWGLILPCMQSSLFAADLSVGNKSVVYIDDGGAMFGWGANGSGQLGDDSKIDRLVPVVPAEIASWLSVATNLTGVADNTFEGHTLAIKADGSGGTQGTLWAWGDNSRGQLGQGDTTERLVPTQVGSASNWVAVEVGSAYSMALNADGEIWIWGDNSFKQLGSGIITDFQAVPTRLADKDGGAVNNDEWISIAAGADYALAVHSASVGAPWGSIYGWGRNAVSQLGLGHDASPVAAPSKVPGSTLWRSVEAGTTSSFGIDSNFFLYAWGQGPFGGLGLGSSSGTSIVEVASPTKVVTSIPSIDRFKSVSAGTSHTLAVSTSGHLFGTGQNASGQLGISGSNLYNVFQYVRADVDLASAGKASSAIVLTDGSLLTAGSNDRGQLGNGTTISASSFTATLLGAVDLSVDSISITSDISAIAPGDTLDFQIIIRNNGTGTVDSALVDATELTIALSPSTIFSAEGETAFVEGLIFEVPAADVADIGPGGSIAVDITATLPNPILANSYYLLVELDTNDTIEESDELNNLGVSLVGQLLNFQADLEISILAPIAATSVNAGATLPVDVEISNTGTGSIPAGVGLGFEYRLLLSSLADESVGNVYDLEITLPVDELPYEGGLDNGDSVIRSITVSIPEEVTLGMYFLGAVVDSGADIDELSESNNTAFTASDIVEIIGISIEEALDIDGVTFPSVSDPKLVLSGDSDFFGKEDSTVITPLVDGVTLNDGSLSSPSLLAGESASLTFTFDEPREVSFRWKSATSSSQNNLFFGANLIPIEPETAGSPTRLSGTKDWEEVSYIVPKDTPVGFTYEQGVAGPDDRVFIDELRVSAPITLPDYIVRTIDYQVGDYVLQQDRLTVTVTGINRGADFPLPDDFSVHVWLSLDEVAGDEDDVSLGELSSFQILDNGSRFIYQAIFSLPEELMDAPYYVLARVDSQNAVTEYNEAVAFTVDDNNFKFSDTAGVNIDRRADLRVTNFIGESEVPIFAGGPTDHPDYNPLASENEAKVFGTLIIEPLAGDNSELAIRFDILNDGLAAVEGLGQAFDVSVYLVSSRDEDADLHILTTFSESGGLAVGAGKTYEVTTNIPDTVVPGQFYYVGVSVDTANAILESREDNNDTLTADNEVFVGEVPLNVALNDSLADVTALEWNDGFEPKSSTQATPSSPWFGQKTIFTRDTSVRAAAQSGPVGSGDSSYMEVRVPAVADGPLLVSFFWKVSSQFEIIDEFVHEDTVTFSVREGVSGPFQTITKISGIRDWAPYNHIINASAGSIYTLRWEYAENGDGTRAGEDAAWVDGFSAESPDFAVSLPGDVSSLAQLQVDNFIENGGAIDGQLEPGDSFDLAFDLQNLGSGAFENVRTQIRLTKSRGIADNLDWNAGSFEDIILFDDFIAFDSGGTSGTFDQTFVIPETISEDGEYYVGVWVEYKGDVSESDEANNLSWTDSALIQIHAPVSFADAVEYTPVTNGWTLLGDGRWFPTTLESAPSDGVDSVASPVIEDGESAGFEAIINGPMLLTFQWKSDTLVDQNYMELRINDVSQDREFGSGAGERMSISGLVDWQEESILIPSGPHVVSWHYIKNTAPGVGVGDQAFVDTISLTAVTLPDLAIQSVDYTAGQYALERDQFPLTVVVKNRGATPTGFNYNDLDLEVRLSEDLVFEDSDAIIGNIGVTEVLNAGQSLVFSGDLDLPINLDDKTYYLLVRVSSLDPAFEEFTHLATELTANNTFASEALDVEILHLPRLVTEMGVAPGVKVYYPKETLYFEWWLINIGLGDISGLESYTQRIELWTFPAGTTDFSDLTVIEKVMDLASITESEYLPGVLSRDDIGESTLEYKTTLALPRAGELLFELGVTSELNEDEDVDVVTTLETLEEYTFFFVIVRDQTIEQSSNLSIQLYSGARFKIAAFPYDTTTLPFDAGESTLTTYGEWRAFNEFLLVGFPVAFLDPPVLGVTLPDPTASTLFPGSADIESLFYYALNLPFSVSTRLEDDAVEGAVLERFGTVFVDGTEYPRLTFPIVRGAEDLKYTVQASNSVVGPWETIIELEPPYLDSRGGSLAGYYGAQALTDPTPGSGSLITLISPAAGGLGYTPIVSALDHNYTATVTVRDYVPFGSGTRFMRLVIELIP